MIHVFCLSKCFGRKAALQDVSFDVAPGEIVGILGPNGAGKTTLMRVLSCFFPATRGDVTVDGFDVFGHSMEVRARVGYLPEHVPLYPDMRVLEYLHFRGALKGLQGRALRRRADEVIGLCGLGDARNTMIGRLSKGYRQRVGLADALVAEPRVLILDEPTIGLDPNQIRQIRALIRGLGGKHTVLLSSHILSEVEATCDRVLILNRGRIAASGTARELHATLKGNVQVCAEIRGGLQEVGAQVGALPCVVRASCEPLADQWLRVQCECGPGTDIRGELFGMAVRNGWLLRELRQERRTLEDVFVQMTGGAP